MLLFYLAVSAAGSGVRRDAATVSAFPIEAQLGAYADMWEVLEMERLCFICPNTNHRIDAGIETDLETLLRIKTKTISMVCPSCGQQHQWRVADAQLTKGVARTSELLHPRA